MKRVRLGQLQVALIDMYYGSKLLIDLRMADLGRRWRVAAAWGHDLRVPFSERYGHKVGPKRWRIGPLRLAWYAPGVD